MMMIAVIMIVIFGSHFVSSTTYTGKFSQDKENSEDQRLQSVELPSISNQLTLRHAPLEVSSSQMNANTLEALSSTIPDYEMQALKDLYDSTDGDNWRWTDGDVHWNFTVGNANPCEWTGLYCTYDRSSRIDHIIKIDLTIHNLYGTLPASLGQLFELSIMAFSSTTLTGTLPASLGQLSKLTVLWLTGNFLTGTLPESLGQLSKLTILGLSNNQLSGSIPDSLGQLSELYGLSLNGNSLTGTLPASLGQLSELYGLSLNDNSLTGTLPASFGQLLKLTDLSLYGNLLTGTLPASLGQLSQLTGLYLDNNQLIGTIPSSLCKCQEMYISLTNNKFICYPTCMTSSRYNVRVDENIPLCDGPSYEDICTTESKSSKSSKSMMILWIVIPILFVLLVAASTYLYYRYRNHYVNISHTSQSGENNQNNNIMDEDNDHINIIDQNLVNFYREIMEVPSDAVDNMHGHVHNSQDPSSYDSNQSMLHIDSHDISNDESNNHHPRQNDLNLRRSDEFSENYYHAIRSYDEARRRIDGFHHNDSGTNEGIFYDGQRIQDNSRVRQRNEGTSRDRRRAHRRNGASNEGRHEERNSGHVIRNDQRNNQILGRCDEYSENNYLAIRHAIRSYDEARRRIEGTCHKDIGTKKGRDHNDKQRNEGTSRDRKRAHERNGANNEDTDSQVLEPVVIGELVLTVAGAVATDNEILNLPTASVTNIDEEDILFVDILVMDRS